MGKRHLANGRPGGQFIREDLMKGAARCQNGGKVAGGPKGVIPGGLVYGEMNMADGAERTITGTSIFDPVLCELAYRWFCPPGGLVLDPFAGGSVRGIVAGKLGRRYLGIDLRPEQLDANRVQATAILGPGDPVPDWRCGDSADLLPGLADVEADFVFSCPPYADLEIYSDDPRDLSTMDYLDGFLPAYRRIIAASIAALKPDRFACFVVGDARDRRGVYYGLPWHTIQAFVDAGAALYNEAVLVTAVGSLPIRAAKQFETTRKLGKTHQNVLVFIKGDPRKATQAIGAVEFSVGDDVSRETVLDEFQTKGAPVQGAPADDAEFGERL